MKIQWRACIASHRNRNARLIRKVQGLDGRILCCDRLIHNPLRDIRSVAVDHIPAGLERWNQIRATLFHLFDHIRPLIQERAMFNRVDSGLHSFADPSIPCASRRRVCRTSPLLPLGRDFIRIEMRCAGEAVFHQHCGGDSSLIRSAPFADLLACRLAD